MQHTSWVKIPVPVSGLDKNLLNEGIWLCLIHVNQIPPHVAVIIDGKYHSLEKKGQQFNIPVPTILKSIQRKKAMCLFLELTVKSKESYVKYASKFTEIEGSVTCLSPIKYYISKTTSLNYLKDEMAPSFVKRLQEHNLILRAICLNLACTDDEVKLPDYTREELQKGLQNILSK